jgi:hypothetical protein
VKNEEVLVKEERDVLNTPATKIRKAIWVGHILRMNCLLKHVTERQREGRLELTVRGRSRRKQLLDYLKKTRGCWKLKE